VSDLPEQFEAQILVGRAVEQICVNANQISLQFGDQLLLVIEGAFCLTTTAPATVARYSPPLRLEAPTFVPELLSLIEQNVVKGQSAQDGALTLQFEKGDVLQVLVDTPMYESYKIYYRGQELIV
jgi:hypothetical protein